MYLYVKIQCINLRLTISHNDSHVSTRVLLKGRLQGTRLDCLDNLAHEIRDALLNMSANVNVRFMGIAW